MAGATGGGSEMIRVICRIGRMAAGEVTPEEAATISGVLEARRRALETQELADRVDRLEQEMKSR
jgi:ubiquinone biosynthesis protein UbiJ